MIIDEAAGTAEPDVTGAVATAGAFGQTRRSREQTKLIGDVRTGKLHFVRAETQSDRGSSPRVERERLALCGRESPYVVAWNSSRIRVSRASSASPRLESRRSDAHPYSYCDSRARVSWTSSMLTQFLA